MKLNWLKYGIDPPRGTSGQRKIFCPKCRDQRTNKSDKSLSINLATGEFLCHYCGFKGCVAENEDWEKDLYAHTHKVKKEYKKPTPHNVNSEFSEKLLAWFKGRGISKETLTKMKITEGQEMMPQKGRKINTVQFNYYRDGELINTKFRTGDKCFKMVQGAELLPYGIDNIKNTEECIITEGEIDALSFFECGRKDVVSVPNGANANLTYLDDYIENYFENKKVIYIASDTDSKGILLKNELIRRFGAEVCKIVTYGEGCKDANEHLVKYGKESLLKCLENAEEVKVEGIYRISDFKTELYLIFKNGLQDNSLTIGFDNFDKLCKFETKRLCVITGIPGSGKSEFLDEIIEHLNIHYQMKVAYFSPENAPVTYHATKLIEKLTGKRFPSKSLQGNEETLFQYNNILQEDEYNEAVDYIDDNFFFISPKEDFRLESILERVKFLVRRKGIKILVIDPYNRLDNECERGANESLYISKQLDRLTNFAQQNDTLIFLVAHPTKMPKSKDGTLETPSLYNISGSANFYNKCDFGIVVHRDYDKKIVEVHIDKVKFKHLGEVGMATFKYNVNNGRYTPYEIGCEPNHDNSNHLRKQREEQEAGYDRPDWTGNDPNDDTPF